jgi:hypothetical protein
MLERGEGTECNLPIILDIVLPYSRATIKI